MDSMEPNPEWERDEDVLAAFAALDDDVVFKIWGADWCPDTRQALPDFAAALAAAGVDEDRIRVHEVDRNKDGEGTEEYDVDRIPTIVVERDGEELARFVEEADVPAATYLAERLGDADTATV
ncbi:MAG: thioredoxin family protein [Halanaeroarchaeum sp.]